MLKTYAARIHNGNIELLEPTSLTEDQRVLVTVLEERDAPRVASKYAGAFSSGHADTAERADELLDELGFAE
jgi:hypothetical protein